MELKAEQVTKGNCLLNPSNLCNLVERELSASGPRCCFLLGAEDDDAASILFRNNVRRMFQTLFVYIYIVLSIMNM